MMKKLVMGLVALMLCTVTVGKKKVEKPELWPNGEVMDAWFKDTTKVDVASLGRQYVLTSYFPVRTARVLRQITDYVHVDETGIIAVTPPSPATDDRFYNLNGQPVSRPRHGLFLKNGRKILVR